MYRVLWYIIAPFLPIYLRKKSRRNPAYLEHSEERFGQACIHNIHRPIALIHAVSVGETRAAEPLLRLLIDTYKEWQWIMTQGTPTGRTTAQQLYQNTDVRLLYLPYDHPKWVRKWLKTIQPKIIIMMETELWPNLLQECHHQNIPSFIANARLSEKSARGYQKILPLLPPITEIWAQSKDDAERFHKIGYKHVRICGNTKFDVPLPSKEIIEKFHIFFNRHQKILLAASTREGEEEEILQAWKKDNSTMLLVIVPRHPERFLYVEQLLKNLGIPYSKRSQGAPKKDIKVWLGDSMGELWSYYSIADVVFVGGSLKPFGCHSFIEPLQLGKPTYIGPSVFNFQHWFNMAYKAQVVRSISSAAQWISEAKILANDQEETKSWVSRIHHWQSQQCGASQRMIDALTAQIPSVKQRNLDV